MTQILTSDEKMMLRINSSLEKAFLSHMHPKTHLIHLDEQHQDDRETPFISTYANALYVLHLFKTKQLEAFENASRRLEQLLHFQIQGHSGIQGLFPMYLHLFPNGADKKIQVKLLIVFKIIKQSVGSLLKNPLKEKFLRALGDLEASIFREKERYTSDPLTAVLLKVLDESIENKWEALLTLDLHASEDANWALILGSHYLTQAQYEELLEKILQLYHGGIKRVLYHYQVQKYQGTIKRSLCDDYIQFLVEGQISPRADMQLEVALIQDREFSNGQFKKYQDHEPFFEEGFYSVISQKDYAILTSTCSSRNFHLPLFQIFLKDGASWVHLVSEGNKLSVKKALFALNTLSLELTYSTDVPIDGHDQVEWDLFLGLQHREGFYVDHEKAMIFFPGQKVSLQTENICLDLVASIIDAENGQFLGQISMGNRPSQKDALISKNHVAYDWKLSLRTLKRTPEFSIKLSFEFSEKKLAQGIALTEEQEPLDLTVFCATLL